MARQKIPLTETQIQEMEALAGYGLNLNQIASVFKMSLPTLNRRLKDTPNAFDTIEKGRAKAAANVAQTAYKLAVSGKVPAMTMFWLKCQQHWKESHTVEVTGKDGAPIKIDPVKYVKVWADENENDSDPAQTQDASSKKNI